MADDQPAVRSRLSRAAREQIVLDTADRLFYARGVHEVGMDELVRISGLGKATVYRLFPTKDHLTGAYLNRLAARIFAEIDAAVASGSAVGALRAVLNAVDADLRRAGFRGCAFNNASTEYGDPTHPARVAARIYRSDLHARLIDLTRAMLPNDAERAGELAAQLAVLIDGAYTSAAHLGPDGPAATGLALAHTLIDQAETRTHPPVGPTPDEAT